MPTFTVHVPPGVADAAARAETTVFVREGFDWAAFVLGPLALLYRGLWRAALAWALAGAALFAVAAGFGLSGPARLLLYLVLATLTGLETAEARRRALGRAGFIPAALVCGVTREGGERAFFAGAGTTAFPQDRVAARPGPPARGAPRPGILGLFPGPGGRVSGGRA